MVFSDNDVNCLGSLQTGLLLQSNGILWRLPNAAA